MKILLYFIIAFVSFANLFSAPLEDALKEYDKGNYTKAKEMFDKVLKSNPKNTVALNFRGLCLMITGKPLLGISDFEEVMKVDSKNADAYNNRGLTYLVMGQTELAYDDFERAIKLDGNHSEALLNRAIVLLDMNDPADARKDLEKSVKLNPKNPEAYFQFGRLYDKIEKIDSAVTNYKKAIKLGKNNGTINFYLANSLFKLKKYDEAINYYNSAVKIEPDNHQYINNRAVCYEQLGKTDLAEADRKYLNLMSGNRFVPVSELKFKTYTDPDNKYSLIIPESWEIDDMSIDDQKVFFIRPKHTAEYHSTEVGITVSYVNNVVEKFNLSDEISPTLFWIQSVMQNTESYNKYDLVSKRQINVGGVPVDINHTISKVTDKSNLIAQYEVGIGLGNDLFFMYMQSPDVEFPYYAELYDYIIGSLKFLKN